MNFLTFLALLLVAATPAVAQDDAVVEDEVARLEEIVVTATKRAESLQDISSSVSAFTTDDILRQGFDSFQDFSRVVPGLTFNEVVKNRGVFNIRGLATNVTGGNTQDPVSVYLNETPITDTFGAAVQPDLRLFDVERIEVLRGPQGTLFGSGSLGGTVRIITNQPDTSKVEVAGRIDAGVSNGGNSQQRYDAMVNVPLIENELALRVVGYYRDEEGWVENLTLGTNNSTKDWGGRVSMLWQPGENFSAKLEAIYQDSDPNDGGRWNPALGEFNKSSSVAEGRPSELSNYGLTLEYDIDGFATLISATTYQESKTAVVADNGDLFGLGLPVLSKNKPWDSEFFTQEIRLVSNTNSNLEWIVGGFFIDRETNVNFLIEVPGLDDLVGNIIGSDAFFDTLITLKSREIAAFGNISYRFAERWKISGGVRVFDTEVSYDEPNRQVLNFLTFTYDTSSFLNVGTDNDSTWRAGLSFEPNDDSMLYANIATGYRIGQANPNNGPSLIDPNDYVIPETYGPDSSINYEIGAKTMLLDGRLIVNAAVFYIDWEDIQIDGTRVSDFRSFIANAGRAESKGVELELNMLPMEGLEIDLAMTWLDAEVTEVPSDIIIPAAVGDTLPGLVDFKISGSVQYSWDAFVNKRMFARIDGQVVESSPNGFANGGANPFFAISDAYENVNASVGLIAENWELALYGKNLTDNNDFILNIGGQFPSPITTLRPLTVGVRFSFKY